MSKEVDFVGVDSMDGETETDRLLFGSRHWKPNRAGEGDFCEVSYSLQKPRGSDKFQLIRERNPFPDADPFDGGEPAVLAEGVHGLHFEFYDGLYWYEKWGRVPGLQLDTTEDLLAGNTTGLPDAVRIVLTFEDPEPPGGASKDQRAGSTVRGTLGSLTGSSPDSGASAEDDGEEPKQTTSEAVAMPYAFQAVVALNLAPRAAQLRTSTTTSGSTDGTSDSQSSSNSATAARR